MVSNLDLYGREDVPLVPATVANFRIILLKERLAMLTSVHFMEQDIHLINKVTEAIEFWSHLRDGETL